MNGSYLAGVATPRMAVLVAFLMWLAAPCSAAILDCGDTHASAGDSGVSLPITLTAGTGENVCGIQFDLWYDGDALNIDTVEIGEAADEAAKDVSFSILEPGRARVIVAGFNQNVIGSGIVSYVVFSVAGDAPDAAYPVTLTAVLLSDPWGLAVPASGLAGVVVVGNPVTGIPDINDDGTCDAIDVQLVVNSALGLVVQHDCDVNGDGVVNALDVQLIINGALGIG